MRLAAETEAEANATLDDLLSKEWTQPPPVIVVIRNPAGDAPLLITAPQGTASVDWTISTEDGDLIHGRNDFSGMRLVDTHACDGRTFERRQMTCAGLPLGYHRLQLEHRPGRETILIVSPGRCWLPPETNRGGRIWGIAAQLYLARADRNWGIGDFTDLRELFELGREWGADVIGVNPLHALFLDKPEEASPYSPLSRYLLNVLTIDIDAIPEVQTSADLQALIAKPEFQQQLALCRAADDVQYTAVAKLKRELLEAAFQKL